MSVQSVAKTVEQEVKELFVIEKAHLQSFLNYLSKRPYEEVFHLVEAMKTARYIPPAPTPAAVPTVVPDTASVTDGTQASS